jgi:transcriptional regulator GlxA family with amidase domain
VEYHEGAHIHSAVRLGKVFGLLTKYFLFFYEELMGMDQARAARKVAILIYDNVEVLDFTGPFEVFLVGSNRGKDFKVFTVAEQEQPVQALGGLSINPRYSIFNCPQPDILIVPGGLGSRTEMNNEKLTSWIREVSDQAELVLSVCTGALILAKAQLLVGLKLTTNRLAIQELRDVMPESAEMVEEERYIDNGKVILSAGISAGIDMSLYVVGRLLGEERAVRTAELIEYDWRGAAAYKSGSQESYSYSSFTKDLHID